MSLELQVFRIDSIRSAESTIGSVLISIHITGKQLDLLNIEPHFVCAQGENFGDIQGDVLVGGNSCNILTWEPFAVTCITTSSATGDLVAVQRPGDVESTAWWNLLTRYPASVDVNSTWCPSCSIEPVVKSLYCPTQSQSSSSQPCLDKGYKEIVVEVTFCLDDIAAPI